MEKNERTRKKKEGAVPEKATPTQISSKLSDSDRAAAASFLSRKKHRAQLPKSKISSSGAAYSIGWDHPVPGVADIHAANLVHSDDLAFSRGFTLQLARSVSRSDSLRSEDIDYALAVVRAIEPRDPTEALLAAQMAAVHAATMHAAQYLGSCQTLQQQDSASNMFNKLARTFAAQIETMKKYRSTGEQSVKVTHQHVSVTAGQAVVGINQGVGCAHETTSQSHAIEATSEAGVLDARSPALLRHEQAIGLPVPGAGCERAESVPNARSPSRCAQRKG